MNIVIVGAGKLGYSIAELLSKEEYDIVVIDKEAERLDMIKNNLDVLTIHASGSSPTTMDDMDVRGADTASTVFSSIRCRQGLRYSWQSQILLHAKWFCPFSMPL